MGKVRIGALITLTVVGAAAIAWWWLSCSSNEILVAIAPVKAYSDYPGSGEPPDRWLIAHLNSGQQMPVIGTRYAKDFMYYKVCLPDGKKGFILHDPNYVRLERR